MLTGGYLAILVPVQSLMFNKIGGNFYVEY